MLLQSGPTNNHHRNVCAKRKGTASRSFLFMGIEFHLLCMCFDISVFFQSKWIESIQGKYKEVIDIAMGFYLVLLIDNAKGW